VLRSTKARHERNGIMFKPAKLYIPSLYIEKQPRGSLLGQTYSLALKRGCVKKRIKNYWRTMHEGYMLPKTK
jgi:hypothetical protein